MSDPSQMSNEELMAIAGIKTNQSQQDVSQVPTDQLLKIAGINTPTIAGRPAIPLEDFTSQSLGMFQPSSLPPQIKAIGEGMVEQLPVAGMVTGGTLGLPGGPITAAAGAGLGGGIGAATRNLIQQGLGIKPPMTPGQNLMDIGQEAAMGATSEAIGPYIAKGIHKITSPFAARMEARMTDPTIKAAQDLVEQQGANISPDIIADTRTSRFFNWLADKVWPASSIMANRRQELQGVADTLKNEFVASRNLYETSKGGVNAAWENWVNMAGGLQAPYEMPKTLTALNEAMKKPFAMQMKTTTDAAGNQITESVPQGVFWKKYAATLRDVLESQGHATVQDIRDIFNTLNPIAAKGAERTARMKIGDAIVEDLRASGNEAMVEALQGAREMGRLNRVAAPLQQLFNKSMIAPTEPGQEVIFNPSNFVNQWNQRRGWFLDNKNYSAEDVRVIDAFVDKMKALIPDLSRAAKYTPAGSLQGITQMNPQNMLGVMGLTYKFPGLAVPVGLDAGLALSMMNPNGVMRRFLTTGFNPPTLSTKMGLMKGMEEFGND